MIKASSFRARLIAAALLVGGCGGGGGSSGSAGSGGAATGGSATGGSATGGSATGGSATGGSATGGSAGTGGTSGANGAAGPFVLTTPSFSIPAGTESAPSVVLDLGNARTVHIGAIKTTLSAGVYEVRIGACSGSSSSPTYRCQVRVDINGKDITPLVFARNATEDLVFPTGVGYTLAAHQYVIFEILAWNPTAAPMDVSVSATFTPMPDASFQQEAGLFVLEETFIDVPAHATASRGPVFFPLSSVLDTASLFRMMGYTHKLGTAVTMATATGASDPAPTSIYAPVWNAASPPVVIKTPPAVLPSSGGVLLSCSWDNSAGASAVYYQGDPLAGERCAGIISYYPARPVHHCIHDVNGIICCPGNPGCPQG